MKSDIHPEYHEKATIACACGHTQTVGSTTPHISVEICSTCHPFYTGKQKLIDVAGRVDKFKKRASKKETTSTERKGKKVKKAAEKAKKKTSSKEE